MKCSTWNYSLPYRLLELAMLGCSNGNRACMPTTQLSPVSGNGISATRFDCPAVIA